MVAKPEIRLVAEFEEGLGTKLACNVQIKIGHLQGPHKLEDSQFKVQHYLPKMELWVHFRPAGFGHVRCMKESFTDTSSCNVYLR